MSDKGQEILRLQQRLSELQQAYLKKPSSRLKAQRDEIVKRLKELRP